MCRATSLTISCAKPQLDQAGVKLIGVTCQEGEELQAYVAGQFWKGDLYFDNDRKTYESAGLTSFTSVFGMLSSLFNFSDLFKFRIGRVQGNNNGIKLVASAILVIKDGKITFEQLKAEEPPMEAILKAAGLDQQAIDDVNKSVEEFFNKLAPPSSS